MFSPTSTQEELLRKCNEEFVIHGSRVGCKGAQLAFYRLMKDLEEKYMGKKKKVDVSKMDQDPGQTKRSVPVISCDQEYWLKERIKTAINMAFALKYQKEVAADNDAFNCAIAGVINGTAVEIVHMLDMETGFVNLSKPCDVLSSNRSFGGPVLGR